jgi:hypothetical protein
MLKTPAEKVTEQAALPFDLPPAPAASARTKLPQAATTNNTKASAAKKAKKRPSRK